MSKDDQQKGKVKIKTIIPWGVGEGRPVNKDRGGGGPGRGFKHKVTIY